MSKNVVMESLNPEMLTYSLTSFERIFLLETSKFIEISFASPVKPQLNATSLKGRFLLKLGHCRRGLYDRVAFKVKKLYFMGGGCLGRGGLLTKS